MNNPEKIRYNRYQDKGRDRKESEELIKLPDQLYRDFQRPIYDFMYDKSFEYRRLAKEFGNLSAEQKTAQQQAHTEQLFRLDQEVDDFVDAKVANFFEYFGTDSFKDHLFFSLPLEVQVMIAHHMHPQTLFATVFLSTKLFSLLQDDKKMVIDTVTVTFATHGIYVIHAKLGDWQEWKMGSIQVVSPYDWRANAKRSGIFQHAAVRWRRASHIPTVTLPCRPTLPCLMKNVIPAKKIRYLRLWPREKDIANERAFFMKAFECADHFDNPSLIVSLPRALSRNGVDTITERRPKIRLVMPDALYPAQQLFNTFFDSGLGCSDLLILLEMIADFDDRKPMQNVSIEPGYSDEDVWRMYERWADHDATMKSAYVKIGNFDRYAALEHRLISSVLAKGYKRDFARTPNCCYISRNVPGDTTNFVYSRSRQIFYMINNQTDPTVA